VTRGADAPMAEKFLALYYLVFLTFPYCAVLGGINNMKGSLQLFVNTPIDLLKEERMSEIYKKV
jgi:hypothetical protein